MILLNVRCYLYVDQPVWLENWMFSKIEHWTRPSIHRHLTLHTPVSVHPAFWRNQGADNCHLYQFLSTIPHWKLCDCTVAAESTDNCIPKCSMMIDASYFVFYVQDWCCLRCYFPRSSNDVPLRMSVCVYSRIIDTQRLFRIRELI